jgi:predicted nucleic acid-binding protein
LKRFVLDASVALRWFLDNPVPAYAARVREAMILGAQVRVPALWHLEMANGLAVAERRGVLPAPELEDSLLDIESMLVESIDSDERLVEARQVLAPARSFRLTAYDAVYLDLALREGLPLATLDDPLRAAARRAGVAVFDWMH